MKRIAIFASGSGSNAENIIQYFKNNENITISLLFTNNKNAYVIERAVNNQKAIFLFDREMFYNTDIILNQLLINKIDLIVLAGFLWLIPGNLIHAFAGKIINIHPALLPKYGGKGMYGMNVHKAVKQQGEKESGITIHYVNEEYDKGSVILQEKCMLTEDDTPETIAAKVHELEYIHFPKSIENLLVNL